MTAPRRPQDVGRLPSVSDKAVSRALWAYVEDVDDNCLFKFGEYSTLRKARAARGAALLQQQVLLKHLLSACGAAPFRKSQLKSQLLALALQSNRFVRIVA